MQCVNDRATTTVTLPARFCLSHCMIGGGVKPMMPILNGTSSLLPSAVYASMVLLTMVHGGKIGLPSRALNTLASTSGKCGPAQRFV